MNTFSNILLNIFLIALIAFALLGGLYNIVHLFTFIRDSVIISKDEKYNLYARTECEGIFSYYADVWKEGMIDPYPNIIVEVKVVSHYRNIFHKPTQQHNVYLNYTSYELQSIRWSNGGYEDFVGGNSFDNKLIMEYETTVKSAKGNTFRVKLKPLGVDAPFQQVRDLKKSEIIYKEKYRTIKKENRKLETRVKVYETIFPELKEFRHSTIEDAKAIDKVAILKNDENEE